jgi:predicted transcriptional regulator of viral defense system
VFAEIYVACRERRPPRKIRGIRYVFAYVSASRFFGFEEISVLGVAVQMATRERALVDALDRPQYAGGLGEVSRMVARSLPRLAPERLLEMLERWGESALAQRLGYLADLHGVEYSPTLRSELEQLVRPGSKILLGPRQRWGTHGTLARRWNIVENVPRDVLVEKGAERRRRVSFRPKVPS